MVFRFPHDGRIRVLYFLACRVAGVLRLRDSRSRTFFDLTHPLLFSWMLIIAAWLPVVLARWPGDFCFDAMWQTAFILPDKTNIPEYWAHLNSWHPPLHSLWLGGSLYLGWSLFQSYSIGLALYTVSQVLLFSFCVARVVSYVYERGHCVLFIFSLLAACLFSGFAVYATMTTKDVAFSGLFSLSVLWVYRSVTDDYDRKRGGVVAERLLVLSLVDALEKQCDTRLYSDHRDFGCRANDWKDGD